MCYVLRRIVSMKWTSVPVTWLLFTASKAGYQTCLQQFKFFLNTWKQKSAEVVVD